MKIELEILRETPLSIADAIITYKMGFVTEEYLRVAMLEDIRMIGKALTDFVESCDRVDEWLERSE